MHVGQTISHYKILNRIGSGGAGDVYRAEDTRLHRIVALKFLRREQLADESMRSRFLREATSTAALDHPNINTIYEIGEQDGVSFIVMAFVEGETLHARIAAGSLPIKQVIEFGAQMADALAAAHATGIVHRDVKSSNIMVAEPKLGAAPHIKLLDFGLAQLSNKASDLTKQGHTVGTPSYMSPEQATGAETDHRTDIWSLGVVLYEMLAGSRPFEAAYEVAILYGIVNEDPTPLTKHRPETPEELQRIIARTLQKECADRYQEASEVAQDLRSLQLSESATQSAVAPAQGPPATPLNRLSRYLVPAGVALALALAVWAFSTRGRRADFQLESLRETPLTSYAGVERFPSLSPSGDEVAFAWYRDDTEQSDIYIKTLDSSEPRRFTSNEKDDYQPQWSPDGETIAWLRGSFGEGPEILQASVDGGAERARTRLSVNGRAPEPRFGWAPDSKTLIISEREAGTGSFALYALGEDGTRRPLTSPPQPTSDGSPTISPDGRTLAFLRHSGYGHRDAFLLALGPGLIPEGEPQRLSNESGIAQSLVWSPDGGYLVYSGSPQLWRLDFSDEIAEPRSLGLFSGQPTHLSFARSGGRLAFSRDTRSSAIRSLSVGSPVNESIPGDELISSTGYNQSPHFAPDGSAIVFSSDRRGKTGLFLADSDGTNVRALHYDPEAHSGAARWSPDGQWVAFDSNRGTDANIFVIPSSGGEVRRLTPDPADDVIPSWSHDSEWIYFNSTRSGTNQIWKKRLDGDLAYQVTINGGEKAFESPDGRFVYFQKGGLMGPLFRVPSNGGEEELIAESVYGRNFAVTAEAVYFIIQKRSEGARAFEIVGYDPRTGETAVVIRLDPQLDIFSGLTVSNETGEFLIVSRSIEGDLVLVEGFE